MYSVKKELQVSDLLSTDFVTVSHSASIEEALESFRNHDSSGNHSIYYVYIEREGDLDGVASVKNLMNSESLGEAKEDEIVTIALDDKLEDVARLMARNSYRALPVVENDRLEGVLRLEDMVKVLEDESTEDIFKKAGMYASKDLYRSEKMLNASLMQTVKTRLPWLLFALAGGILAGTVIEAYETALQTFVVLAFFIPVIMDMGGNVGTQSSTILVRGMALDTLNESSVEKRMVREAAVGLVIGMIVGSIAGAATYFWQGSAQIAYVIAISMVMTCSAASVIGTAIPIIAEKLGYDPAAVSDPMVTTIKDITALIIYFGTASIILGI